jgi:glyoxylase-like metal-dependent hydrolase (beta-lactamase superfamily II)
VGDVQVFGSCEVRRVVEWVGPIKRVDEMFPDTPQQAWTENVDWLDPAFYVPADNAYRCAIQTWVVRCGDITVIVDTGVGNGRDRPQAPLLADLHTDFADRLEATGIDRFGVDFVVNTHIHYDHVGWNTTLADGKWVPTFPNARYLVPQRDRDYFHPDNASKMRPPNNDDEAARFAGIRLVYADSIAPIEDAGQLVTWEGEHVIDDRLRLELTPGHTPGSSVLWLNDGRGAVFAGDLLHSPLQVSRPDDVCSFDLDAETARASRRDILGRAAHSGRTIFFAHCPGPGGFTVANEDDQSYAIDGWASLPPI